MLHGSSGVPATQIQEAIYLGICKVNLATEIKNVFMRTLKTELTGNDEIDLRKVFPIATQHITDLIKEKLVTIKNQRD